MKRFFVLVVFVIGCALPLKTGAQGTFLFSLGFPDTATPPSISIPFGSASLVDDSFHVTIFLGNFENTSGRIIEREPNGEITPIFQLDQYLVDALRLPNGGGTVNYSFDQEYQLNAAQIRNLFAGNWCAEVTINSEPHLGPILPVPEPGVILNTLLGCGVISYSVWRRRSPSKTGSAKRVFTV